jgi:hypothetical protein
MSISRDMSKNQFSLQLSSVNAENKDVCYCAKDKVWDSTDTNLPAGALMTLMWQSAPSKLSFRTNSGCRYTHELFFLKLWFLP